MNEDNNDNQKIDDVSIDLRYSIIRDKIGFALSSMNCMIVLSKRQDHRLS